MTKPLYLNMIKKLMQDEITIMTVDDDNVAYTYNVEDNCWYLYEVNEPGYYWYNQKEHTITRLTPGEVEIFKAAILDN